MNHQSDKSIRIDFYYWNYQCPLNFDTISLLSKYANCIDIHLHDVTSNHPLAMKMELFFPTLMVVNNKFRYYAPITESFLNSILEGKLPVEKPFIPQLGTKVFMGDIVPITHKNSHITCSCTGGCSENARYAKAYFRKNTSADQICGFVNIDDENTCVGGIEWVESKDVPYNIPKSRESVFITCLYSSNPKYDYKSIVLSTAEAFLFDKYKTIYIISDELSVFPNGNLEYFLRNGYKNQGVIFYDSSYCKLHLLKKTFMHAKNKSCKTSFDI